MLLFTAIMHQFLDSHIRTRSFDTVSFQLRSFKVIALTGVFQQWRAEILLALETVLLCIYMSPFS